MPSVSGVAPSSRIATAIAAASERTGADFDYMVAQARIESSFDPGARARTSSAAGLYQFTSQTWLRTLRDHGAQHGYSWASAAIGSRGGKAFVADPALRQQVMDLRFDPQAAALMAGELAGDNAAYIASATGTAPDSVGLYLAHFLGAGGAAKFLTAMASDPSQSAAALFPDAAAANAGVFRPDGRDRTLGEVHALFAAKLDGGSTVPWPGAQPDAAGSWTQGWAEAAPAMPAAAAEAPQRASMAEVLAGAFGGSGSALGERAGRHVAAAYGRIAGAGL